MKKLMTLFLALALAASLTVPALAGFTPSVENKGGPTVVDAVFEDGTPVGRDDLRVTAYGKRNDYNDNAAVAIKKILEDAHTEVKSAGRRDSLTADVNTWLTDHHAGVKAEDLLVSDLFDVSFVQGGELLEGKKACGVGVLDEIVGNSLLRLAEGVAPGFKREENIVGLLFHSCVTCRSFLIKSS